MLRGIQTMRFLFLRFQLIHCLFLVTLVVCILVSIKLQYPGDRFRNYIVPLPLTKGGEKIVQIYLFDMGMVEIIKSVESRPESH